MARDVGDPSDTVYEKRLPSLQAGRRWICRETHVFSSNNGELRRMAMCARRQAEMETWEAIGRRVATENMGDVVRLLLSTSPYICAGS